MENVSTLNYLVIFTGNLERNIMTTFNKQITKEQATELFNSKNGMNFPDTDHNRKMMKLVVGEYLLTLRPAQ